MKTRDWAIPLFLGGGDDAENSNTWDADSLLNAREFPPSFLHNRHSFR